MPKTLLSGLGAPREQAVTCPLPVFPALPCEQAQSLSERGSVGARRTQTGPAVHAECGPREQRAAVTCDLGCPPGPPVSSEEQRGRGAPAPCLVLSPYPPCLCPEEPRGPPSTEMVVSVTYWEKPTVSPAGPPPGPNPPRGPPPGKASFAWVPGDLGWPGAPRHHRKRCTAP